METIVKEQPEPHTRIIELRGATFCYTVKPHKNYRKPSLQLDRAALRNVSVCIPRGSITAVLGPNGAGKSTMLDLCLGWKQPLAGEVLLRGRSIKSYSRKEMGRIVGLVPQNEQLQFDYSLLEYVLLGRAPYLRQLELPGEREVKVAEEALKQVGIFHLAERRVTQLSGGEHQLLMIARSLAQQPEMLILDEPTSQLDPGNRLRIVNLLRRLNGEGKTIMFTTHDPSLAAALAGHVILLKNGALLQAGDTEQTLTGEHLSQLYDVPVEVTMTATRAGKKRVVLY